MGAHKKICYLVLRFFYASIFTLATPCSVLAGPISSADANTSFTARFIFSDIPGTVTFTSKGWSYKLGADWFSGGAGGSTITNPTGPIISYTGPAASAHADSQTPPYSQSQINTYLTTVTLNNSGDTDVSIEYFADINFSLSTTIVGDANASASFDFSTQFAVVNNDFIPTDIQAPILLNTGNPGDCTGKQVTNGESSAGQMYSPCNVQQTPTIKYRFILPAHTQKDWSILSTANAYASVPEPSALELITIGIVVGFLNRLKKRH